MKHTANVLFVVIAALFAVACQPVNSSELKTTLAEDLRITATVYEYKDASLAETTAQMQTLASHVGIALDQGETLVIESDMAEGLSEKVFLSNAAISSEDFVDDIMHRCAHHCEEGETAVFTVADEEYSCCIEE